MSENFLDVFNGLTATTVLPPRDICFLLKRIRQISLALDQERWDRVYKMINELDEKYNCGAAYYAYDATKP